MLANTEFCNLASFCFLRVLMFIGFVFKSCEHFIIMGKAKLNLAVLN